MMILYLAHFMLMARFDTQTLPHRQRRKKTQMQTEVDKDVTHSSKSQILRADDTPLSEHHASNFWQTLASSHSWISNKQVAKLAAALPKMKCKNNYRVTTTKRAAMVLHQLQRDQTYSHTRLLHNTREESGNVLDWLTYCAVC